MLVRGLNGFARAALRMAVAHPERLSAAVRAGYLAPYDSWANRIAIERFVADIPMRPTHPSYATLLEIEQTACHRWRIADPIDLGHARLVLHAAVFGSLSRIVSGRGSARLEDAGHWVVEDAHERIIPMVEEFLGRCP